MKRNVIKTIIHIVISFATMVVAYKLGSRKGYESCPDIPDFEGLYS